MAITAKEIKQLASLLKKIDKPDQGLPQPVFDKLVNIVPFVACELIFADKRGMLLTWREDKWFKGWHFPGGLLRFNESFEERIKKVASKELGVDIKKYKFLFPINFTDGSRGHAVSMVFLCTTDMAPNDGKFFKKMPKDTLECHKELWEKVQKKLKNNYAT